MILYCVIVPTVRGQAAIRSYKLPQKGESRPRAIKVHNKPFIFNFHKASCKLLILMAQHRVLVTVSEPNLTAPRISQQGNSIAPLLEILRLILSIVFNDTIPIKCVYEWKQTRVGLIICFACCGAPDI